MRKLLFPLPRTKENPLELSKRHSSAVCSVFISVPYLVGEENFREGKETKCFKRLVPRGNAPSTTMVLLRRNSSKDPLREPQSGDCSSIPLLALFFTPPSQSKTELFLSFFSRCNIYETIRRHFLTSRS